jgi:hypothetical protein
VASLKKRKQPTYVEDNCQLKTATADQSARKYAAQYVLKACKKGKLERGSDAFNAMIFYIVRTTPRLLEMVYSTDPHGKAYDFVLPVMRRTVSLIEERTMDPALVLRLKAPPLNTSNASLEMIKQLCSKVINPFWLKPENAERMRTVDATKLKGTELMHLRWEMWPRLLAPRWASKNSVEEEKKRRAAPMQLEQDGNGFGHDSVYLGKAYLKKKLVTAANEHDISVTWEPMTASEKEAMTEGKNQPFLPPLFALN